MVLMSLGTTAYGLPQNFNTTQGAIPYAEITSPHFRVYFDARAPHEGRIISESLDGIRPLLAKWLQISRRPHHPLRVVSSPVTNHASFANFIYDAIELQTKNQNIRDLIWHEYVHSLTYEFYRNVLGPPGTIFHIMWMPAWFLEGLAEALSISVGSDYQAGVERWQALTNQWPTYARLHSLYLNYTWSTRGYATAGAFVGWILKNLYTAEDTSLSVADLLRDFRTQTMPWHLLRHLFNPLDGTLKSRLHASGKQLYEHYKRGATAYWQVASPYPLLASSPEPRHHFPFGALATEVQNGHLIIGNAIERVHLTFNPTTHWGTQAQLLPLPKGAVGRSALRSQDFLSYILTLPPQYHDGLAKKNAIVVGQQRSNLKVIWQGDRVTKLFHTRQHLGWVVQGIASTAICTLEKSTVHTFIQQRRAERPRAHCKPLGRPHNRIHILGGHPDPNSTSGEILALWFGIESSALTGDSYAIKIWRAGREQIISKPWHPLAKPISAAFSGDDIWLLTSDRSRTYLSRVTLNKRCVETIHFSDYLLGAWGLGVDRIALRLYEGHKSSFKLIIPSTLPKYPCPTPEPHSSPLLDGMRILTHHHTQADPKRDAPAPSPAPLARQLKHVPTLEAVMMRTHTWRLKHYKESFYKLNHAATNTPAAAKQFGALDPIRLKPYVRRYAELSTQVLPHDVRHRALLTAPTFGPVRPREDPLSTTALAAARPYTHRWSSPVFFPWLGYHPIRGDQFGLISVPLIDDLQNHLIRGTVLFGLNSYFPDLNVSYYGTRYRFPISVNIFRNLLYNGWLYDPSQQQYITHYLNEFGAQFQLHYSGRRHQRLTVQYILGWKTSHLEADHTPHITSTGIKHEPYISAGLRLALPQKFALSLRGAVMAPLGLYNSHFDYYKLRLRLGLSHKVYAFKRTTTLEVASSYGHTRGDPDGAFHLKELYTPILTIITGSASTETALNRIRRPLLGNNRFLYRIYFGDTYIRNLASLSTPILQDIDKQISIFYLKQLTFNLFVNWGQTWWAQTWGEIKAQPFKLNQSVLAYAGAVDLHLENKGVNFFVGIGLGELVGEGMLIYNQFGFTALF